MTFTEHLWKGPKCFTDHSSDQNLIDRIESDIAGLNLYDRPGRSITVTSQNRQLLRSWLIAKGVDVNRATKASNGTLASAWKTPAYLAAMEKQKWTSKWTSGGKSIDLDAADAANLETMLYANKPSGPEIAPDFAEIEKQVAVPTSISRGLVTATRSSQSVCPLHQPPPPPPTLPSPSPSTPSLVRRTRSSRSAYRRPKTN